MSDKKDANKPTTVGGREYHLHTVPGDLAAHCIMEERCPVDGEVTKKSSTKKAKKKPTKKKTKPKSVKKAKKKAKK